MPHHRDTLDLWGRLETSAMQRCFDQVQPRNRYPSFKSVCFDTALRFATSHSFYFINRSISRLTIPRLLLNINCMDSLDGACLKTRAFTDDVRASMMQSHYFPH